MKLIVTPSNLRAGVTPAAGASPTRTTLPVLSHVRIEADAEGVMFTGTDLDVGVLVRVAADVEQQGTILLDGRRLGEIANAIPGQPVHLSAEADRIAIRCGSYRGNLVGLPAEEFPSIPTFDFTRAARLPASLVQDMIQRVSWAVSREETRPILQGVLWQIEAEAMRMVATDGHRLAVYEVPVSSVEDLRGDLIVPARALENLRKLVDSKQDIEVARAENYVAFRQGDVQVYCRLIEGPYPNYKQVIREDNDKFAETEAKLLDDVLKLILITASDQTHRIRFSLNGTTRLSADTPDLGGGSQEIPVSYDGDPMEIGFNGLYFREVLKYMPTRRIKMAFKAPERAAIFYPAADDDAELPLFKILLMPLRLLD